MPKDEILSSVRPDTYVEENNPSVHVLSLRKALGADALLETGAGWSEHEAVGRVLDSLAPDAG